jgi:hypothetical protein
LAASNLRTFKKTTNKKIADSRWGAISLEPAINQNMRQVKVKLIGLTSLLQNNISSMQTTGVAKKVNPTPEADAASRTYWTPDRSSLALPAVAVHRSLMKAGSKFKLGKQTWTGPIASAVHVTPEFIPLNTTTYKLDFQSVIVNKGRIQRVRPRILPWEVEFELHFDDVWITIPAMAQIGPELFAYAGAMVGVCDFRPECKGQYGKFRLGHYELLPERQSDPVPPPTIIGWDQDSQQKPSRKKAA